MEADSTTYDCNAKHNNNEHIPFHTRPSNLKLFLELTSNSGEKCLERQIVERLQTFGVLPNSLKCSTDNPDCRLVCKPARVIDRVQWHCEGCGKRQSIRSGSLFLRLQCSLLQALQMILAWCEDADCNDTAEHFGVKPKVASMIYDKLDEIAVKEQAKLTLGGENSVVLAEMYPECLNRLSPDTTDQPHVHRILMLADTNHIPTTYKLHVIKDELKKHSVSSSDSQSLAAEVERLVGGAAAAGSLLVRSARDLARHCDPDMQHFVTTRIWRQAVTLCSASRELCAGAGAGGAACAAAIQRYLDTSLFRLRHGDGFYCRTLRLLAADQAGVDAEA